MAFKVINGKLVRTHRNKNFGVPMTPKTEPPSPLKGKYMGLCNRSACLVPGPTWWNTGSRAYYCGECAYLINKDGCERYKEPDICHKVTGFVDGQPQFDPTLIKTRRDYIDQHYD